MPAKSAAAVVVAAAAIIVSDDRALDGNGTPCFAARTLAIDRPMSASRARAGVAGSAVASSQPRIARRTLQSAWSAAPAEARLLLAEEEEELPEVEVEVESAAAPATIGSIASCSIDCFSF